MKLVGFDTETFPLGLRPEGARPKVNCNPVPKLVCLSYYHDQNDKGVVDATTAVEMFVDWLNTPALHMLAHNNTFDALVMARAVYEQTGEDVVPKLLGAMLQGRFHDTMIREKILEIGDRGLERKRFSLDALVKKYFGVDISASKKDPMAWRLRYNELAPWPIETWPEDAIDYALEDAMWAREIFDNQAHTRYARGGSGPQISGPSGVMNESWQVTAGFNLGLMSAWGMSVDQDFAQRLDAVYAELYDELKVDLQSRGLVSKTGTESRKEVQLLFSNAYAELGIDPTAEHLKDTLLTPTEAIATNAKARAFLEDQNYEDERFLLLSKYNQLEKLRSNYLRPAKLAGTHPVCTRYSLVESGRTSSSGPNVQNLPKRDKKNTPWKSSDIRKCFVPRPGNIFLDADYSALELCTLAQVCINQGIPNVEMANALNAGRDLHLDMASQLLGMTYEACLAIYQDDDHPRWKEIDDMRSTSKVLNFGAPGGLGPRGFSKYARGFGLKISPEESADLLKNWRDRWTEMESYFGFVRSLKGQDDYFIVQQDGPGRMTEGWRVRSCDRYTSACNSRFQGLAADGCKAALAEIANVCYVDANSPLYGFRPCAFIHDQFLVEGPEERASAAADELVRVMIEGMKIFVPDVPIKVSMAISDRWDAKAKSKRDDDGVWSIHRSAA